MQPGARLAEYTIVDLLGAGGMGEVYRAHDPRLGRDIAIKILPPAATADADRRARFTREAQAIAALNHPNIVTIHSVEQSGEIHFLTMELVEGRTLRDLLPHGGLSIDRFLDIAIALSDAIGAAHSQHVVHRDLKPANVMVTTDGRVKVLDFGLAKLTARAAGADDLPTLSTPQRTADGTVLGTVEYMSPEQAQGFDVDHRSDMFSLGVVLFEMATGQRPFKGDSSASVIASILRDVPPLVTAARPELPQELSRLIRRCLAKEPGRRYQSALDLRNELDEIRQDPSSATPAASAPVRPRSLIDRLGWFAAGLMLLVAAYAAWPKSGERTPPEKSRTMLQPPTGVQVEPQSAATILAISPDGRWVAFTGNSGDTGRSGLYLRSIGELDSKYVREGAGASPFFSPDSRWLGYWANGAIWRMRVEGGQPERICDEPTQPRGVSWGDNGTIVISGGAALLRVSATGGEPSAITSGDIAQRSFFPHVLPGGKAALVMVLRDKKIAVVSLETGQILRTLFEGATPKYIPGFLIFRRLDVLYAVPFDVKTLATAGEPHPVLEGISFNTGGSETSSFDVSMSGALVFTPPLPRADAELVWVDRQGRTEALTSDRRDYVQPTLDPQGGRVAVHIVGSGESDLWMYDMGRESWTRLTRGMMTIGEMAWSDDGQWIVFTSQKANRSLFRIRLDGHQPEQLTRDAPNSAYRTPYDFASSIHHNVVMFHRQIGNDRFALMTMQLDPPGAAEPFLQTDARTSDGQISPDGLLVAYASTETGGRQIAVRSIGDRDKFRVVIAEDATRPRWSRDGRTLFYVKAGEIWGVPIATSTTGAAVRPEAPQLVLGKRALGLDWSDSSRPQPSPDGNRFLVVKRPSENRSERVLVYVPNWADEMNEAQRRKR